MNIAYCASITTIQNATKTPAGNTPAWSLSCPNLHVRRNFPLLQCKHYRLFHAAFKIQIYILNLYFVVCRFFQMYEHKGPISLEQMPIQSQIPFPSVPSELRVGKSFFLSSLVPSRSGFCFCLGKKTTDIQW